MPIAAPGPARPTHAHTISLRSFASAQLIEISAHSLFSKWFSESGKLVARLFAHINEMVDDGACMLRAVRGGQRQAREVDAPV
jgi:hypothetical protein